MAVYTTIDNPAEYFNTIIYTGDGGQDVTGVGFQPDLVWVKARGNTYNHQLHDSVRGATAGMLSSNLSAAESGLYEFDSFDSDGFTTDSGNITGVNGNTHTQVSWCWKESATAGFDIITYSGTGSAKTESHSLSATPHWIITKCRSDAQSWATHHRSYSATEKVMYLDNTNAVASTDPDWLTAVSSSTISLGGSGSDANTSGRTYVAYLWSEKQGYSKFGSYTGNGNADGPFVYTGFKPAMIITKRTDTTGNWLLYDNKRDTDNIVEQYLMPHSSNAEATASYWDFLSNGFKNRTGASAATNASGGTYIYMAFAEAPFVNSNGVPCNAR
jgi:hypothetical protein